MTITSSQGTYPGWLEVLDESGALKVRMQPRSGSVRPVADAKIEGGHLILNLGTRLVWDLTAQGDKLTGALKREDAEAAQISGVRAPKLDRKAPASWSKPEPLFTGKDLAGWEPMGTAQNHWVAKDGVLLNETKGANLKSTRKFEDFKLHIEFNCPDKGNSGIYLRGRYEVQVEYEPSEDEYHRLGAVYGFVPVKVTPPRKPGEWESFDITFVGRRVTVVRNGVTVIDHQEIAGITGGALDSNEGDPGPFYLQGDHTGGMMYRNITVATPKR